MRGTVAENAQKLAKIQKNIFSDVKVENIAEIHLCNVVIIS